MAGLDPPGRLAHPQTSASVILIIIIIIIIITI